MNTPSSIYKDGIARYDFPQVLVDHLAETQPETPLDYIGKEHFMYLGMLAGFPMGHGSKLFNTLSLPVLNKRRYVPRLPRRIMSIDELGLVSAKRADIGFPEAPQEGRVTSLHSSNNELMYRVNAYDMLLQVDGIINFSTDREILRSLYGYREGMAKVITGIGHVLEQVVPITEEE